MKKFMTIWAGELISNIGSGMTAFALSVYVYKLTGSVTWVSIVTLLAYLPTILLNPLGGILADRKENGLLSGSIGKLIGTGQGRGIGLMLIIAGVLMVAVALVLGSRKSIREIEVVNCEHELENALE